VGAVVEEKLQEVVVEETGSLEAREEEEVKTVEEIELPVEGSESKCKILLIRVGKLGELIPIDRIKNPTIRESYEQKKNRLAIQVVCKEENTGEVFEDTIVFSFHPNARYPKIAARYRKLRVGMEVSCRVENKRWKIF